MHFLVIRLFTLSLDFWRSRIVNFGIVITICIHLLLKKIESGHTSFELELLKVLHQLDVSSFFLLNDSKGHICSIILWSWISVLVLDLLLLGGINLLNVISLRNSPPIGRNSCFGFLQ